MTEPTDRQEPIRRWPGSGWVARGTVVVYGGSQRWVALRDTSGKPQDGLNWRRLD
jgi:hypothetical protein